MKARAPTTTGRWVVVAILIAVALGVAYAAYVLYVLRPASAGQGS